MTEESQERKAQGEPFYQEYSEAFEDRYETAFQKVEKGYTVFIEQFDEPIYVIMSHQTYLKLLAKNKKHAKTITAAEKALGEKHDG